MVKIYQGGVALKGQVSPAFERDHTSSKEATSALAWLCHNRADGK